MLDAVESRFSAVGLKPNLGKLKVVRSGATPEIARVADGQLILADTQVSKEQLLFHVVRAIGFDRADHFTEEATNCWTSALVSVSPTRVQAIQQSLQAAGSFQEALDQLEMPVTRLVAVHLFNGLIAGGMSFANAKTVDLERWGATTDLISGRSLFSLLPLLGVYAPRYVSTVFPEALASLVCDNLATVTHTDVRAEFSNLVVGVFNSDLAT